MLLFESLFIFFYFLVSAKIWLAKRPSCPTISCSWAATRLASMVAFLISVAFCINFSSFSFSSFSFFSISFFLSSVSIAARQLRTSNVLLWGQLQKWLTRLYSFFYYLLAYLFPDCTIMWYDELILLNKKHLSSTKCWKPCLIRSSEGNQGNRLGKGGKRIGVVRTDNRRRSVYGHVITKFSRMDRFS